MDKQFVIAGLGNPGPEYALTRHNMGFLVVQGLASRLGSSFGGTEWQFREDKQLQASVAKGKLAEGTLHLLLPMTYMNASGQAIRRYLDFYKLTPENLIVVCDDVAIAFGQLRVRSMGGSGGHNGLKSIQAHLHTQQYTRLRMGIGMQAQQPLAEYVLDRFTAEEMKKLPEIIDEGIKVLIRLIQEETVTVMNAVNIKQKSLGEEV